MEQRHGFKSFRSLYQTSYLTDLLPLFYLFFNSSRCHLFPFISLFFLSFFLPSSFFLWLLLSFILCPLVVFFLSFFLSSCHLFFSISFPLHRPPFLISSHSLSFLSSFIFIGIFRFFFLSFFSVYCLSFIFSFHSFFFSLSVLFVSHFSWFISLFFNFFFFFFI